MSFFEEHTVIGSESMWISCLLREGGSSFNVQRTLLGMSFLSSPVSFMLTTQEIVNFAFKLQISTSRMLFVLCIPTTALQVRIWLNLHCFSNEDRDNPPSYESIFGKMKDCGEETKNTFGVLRQSSAFLVGEGKSN